MSLQEHIVTVVIGGAAGDGVREAGTSLGTLLTDLGFEAHLSFKYPSLIRGGHNYARLSFSKEKIYYDHSRIDVLVALNDETIEKHRAELNPNAAIFAGNFAKEDVDKFGQNAVALPMAQFTKGLNAPLVARSSVALGAVCYLLNLSLEKMAAIFGDVFKEKGMEANVALAKMGYEHLTKLNFKHNKILAPEGKTIPKELVEGNAAFARGLVAAGLTHYIGYPMTPSSSILHFLAKKQNDFKIKVIQPENELAVVNMALGISYAGGRVAIGTATGGFALMEEAFSFANGAELPLAIAVSQRYAPATGAPTHVSQADLRFALHAGHGEFPRIVLAPGDSEEAFIAGANALNLAWKYQMPVIVLLDKHVSENMMTSFLDVAGVSIEKGKLVEKIDGGYERYALSDDGVSQLAFPGTPNAVVKVNSYEHDESGIVTEEMDMIKMMQEKRFRKRDTLMKELSNFETVKIHGDETSQNVVLFWGSTKTPVLETAKYLKTQAKLVQIVWMEPLDVEKVKKALEGAKKIVDVEMNHEGQLAGLLREKTGIEVTDKILRYDSRPFEPVELAEELDRRFMM